MKKNCIVIILIILCFTSFSQELKVDDSLTEDESLLQTEIEEPDDNIELNKSIFICKFNPGPALLHFSLLDVTQNCDFIFFHSPLTWQWMFKPALSLDIIVDLIFMVEVSFDVGLTYYFNQTAPEGFYVSVSLGASSGLSVLSGQLFSMNGSIATGYQLPLGKNKKWLFDAGLGASWYGGAFNNLISPNLNLAIGRIF